jgi:hypothetical protein
LANETSILVSVAVLALIIATPVAGGAALLLLR